MSGDRDFDEAWQEIVSGFDRDAPDQPRSADPHAGPDVGGSDPGRRLLRRGGDPAEGADATAEPGESPADSGWADIEARLAERSASAGGPAAEPDDPDDHYVPPEPDPVPRGDAVTRWAWVGLLGGPLLLTLATLLGWGVSGWPVIAVALGFLAGFVTLVARMGDRPRIDDGPDDGAVV
jgi:hypothetical protein